METPVRSALCPSINAIRSPVTCIAACVSYKLRQSGTPQEQVRIVTAHCSLLTAQEGHKREYIEGAMVLLETP